MPVAADSLSARLLVLTVAFVMLSEVLIFVPSVAFFRVNYLEKMVESAHLASLTLISSPDYMISEALKEELLAAIGARAIAFKSPNTRSLILSEAMPPKVDARFDLEERSPLTLMADALATLMMPDGRIIEVSGPIAQNPNASIEVLMDETPLRASMLGYAWNILQLSVIISLLTATLVYLALQWMMVRPMRQLTASMVAFRREPENASRVVEATRRRDEIGVAERELREMQIGLRQALHQKTHLAALGAAMTKVNHDLRNMLAAAQILSDRLSQSSDPEVTRLVPRLFSSIDRAIDLCTSTLRYGRAVEPEPKASWFPLLGLLHEVEGAAGLPAEGASGWQLDVPADLAVHADREQLFRVFLNLGRNAVEALGEGGRICVEARPVGDMLVIEFADNGPGLPQRARDHLFEPFAGSTRAGGTGLGLSIARELLQAHGGAIELARSDASGTVFRITLPMRKLRRVETAA
ncbi:Nitrogen regulation protein NR(II) [Oceanibacterium hippocampi]|uniref:histidine kinase n=2 Tax=Oceanibacterium hippocampi TaxID=745714 RepID=A0A1Y5RY95_9PROT|nr:Nitrogen regulation protein NR(II) [Oceanibacterium hippocampi]